MQCPICAGPMWDNTVDKKNPKGPDYKCKNKECGHAVWLDNKKPTIFKPPKPEPIASNNSQPVGSRAMVMAYAKDLIVAQITAGTGPQQPLKSIIFTFRSLWQEVERPGSVVFKEE